MAEDRHHRRRTVLRAGLGAAAIAAVGSPRTTSAHAATDELDWIIDCDSWGARPPRRTPSLSGIPTNKIIVHHMAFPNVTDYSREQAVKLALDCQDLHMDQFGWMDTGQHFTISRGGYVLEGRHRSLEALQAGERQVISAHCPGENGRAIGIENEGTYIDLTPPRALMDSLVRLCTAVCRQYGLGPSDIFGHWDFRYTQCPGAAFYRQFPDLRRAVARALGTRIRTLPKRRWPDIWRFVSGPVVRMVQQLLNEHGADLEPDGYYGALTLAAVQGFQERIGLEVDIDGTLTPQTWESLVDRRRFGDGGPAVEGLQYILADKLYAVGRTGRFDHATAKAVQSLQRLHGADPTGRVDTDTWCAVVGGTLRSAF